MKKLLVLLLATLMVFSLVACNNPDTNKPNNPNDTNSSENSNQPALKDPQKEEAMSLAELNELVTNTGALSKYNVVYTFSTNVDSKMLVLVNDGTSTLLCNTVHNIIAADGTMSLSSMKEEKYSFTESKKYIKEDEEWKATDSTFTVTAADLTYATIIDELTTDGFFAALVENLGAANYNVIYDTYSLPAMNFTVGETSLSFDHVTLTFQGGYLFSIVCSNGTQTMSFELMYEA